MEVNQEKVLLEKLTEEEEENILSEVGYTKRQLEADLIQFKEWLEEQHHLPLSRLKEKDSFLKFYLTGCKGSLEKAKRKLDAYYTYRHQLEVLEIRDPLDSDYMVAKKLSLLAFSPRVEKTSNGTFVRFNVNCVSKKMTPDNFDFKNFLKKFLNIIDLWMREESYNVKICVLADFTGSHPRHLITLNPLWLKDVLYFYREALPIRFSMIYVINTPSHLVTVINNLILPLCPKQIREKVYITAKGFEEVSQHFVKRSIPSEYGGELPSLLKIDDLWHTKEEDYREHYMNEWSEKCDESKRIIHEDTLNPYFGVSGSLKKLVID